MISFKVTDNRNTFIKELRDLESKVDGLKRQYLERAAEFVVKASPVDTGTYITNHHLTSGRQRGAATESSDGKPQNQPRDGFEVEAFVGLLGDIERLEDQSVTTVYISNSSKHAPKVEDELGYAPYTKLRREAENLAQQAIRDSGIGK